MDKWIDSMAIFCLSAFHKLASHVLGSFYLESKFDGVFTNGVVSAFDCVAGNTHGINGGSDQIGRTTTRISIKALLHYNLSPIGPMSHGCRASIAPRIVRYHVVGNSRSELNGTNTPSYSYVKSMGSLLIKDVRKAVTSACIGIRDSRLAGLQPPRVRRMGRLFSRTPQLTMLLLFLS